ncbi:protein wntless homolog [Rhopilema esculentum]|uniref:protein wntless homolog n=1 Tax=Rhopilema esculentum TaxID=499914 RepID=UPI0031E04F3A
MAGVLLESLTRKQLIIFTGVALASVVIFFVLGGTKVSTPATALLHIATPCNSKGKPWGEAWYRRTYTDGSKEVKDANAPCEEVTIGKINSKIGISDVVFSVHMPHPGLEFSPYQQFVVVSMNTEIDMEFDAKVGPEVFNRTKECTIYYKAKVGYKDKLSDKWTLYKQTDNEKRPLKCLLTQYRTEGDKMEGYYTCEDMHFLEIGSIQHPYYLINMQLKPTTRCFGVLKGLHFVEIHQNGSYTRAWFIAKTVLTPFLIAALIFFFRRIKAQPRAPILLEKLTAGLGLSLLFLVLPIEWLTIAFDMPYMLLLSDLRQGQFYAFLLSFWCIFVGEHILDQQKRGTWRNYKWQLVFVILACLALLIFDLIERGVQLHNPFHTIWKKDNGETAAKGFIIVAAISSILFVLFFFGLVIKVFRHMSVKGNALPVMQEARRIYYQGVIYRFRALVTITLMCVIMTVLCFVLDQVNEGHWKFIEDNPVNDVVQVSSALHFGTFGMWNVYVISVLILYSPNEATDSSTVRYRAANAEQREHLTIDDPSEDSLNDASVSTVYQLSGQHIKE